MSTLTRAAVLQTLTGDDLFETAVALAGHIEVIRQIIAAGGPGGDWQARLEIARRAHRRITDARLAQ
jgi:hypothetical protein